MKNDPITKLYIGLTDKERAALAFSYAMQQNEVERRRIESVMPMQQFTGLPFEYRCWIYNLQNIAMLYAIEHWRLVAHIQTCAAGAMVMLKSDDEKEWRPVVERHAQLEAELLSLETALDAVCTTHGLDPDTMRRMAGTTYYEISRPGLTPDADFLAGVRASFSELMEV